MTGEISALGYAFTWRLEQHFHQISLVPIPSLDPEPPPLPGGLDRPLGPDSFLSGSEVFVSSAGGFFDPLLEPFLI